jgi:hypothetical protein
MAQTSRKKSLSLFSQRDSPFLCPFSFKINSLLKYMLVFLLHIQIFFLFFDSSSEKFCLSLNRKLWSLHRYQRVQKTRLFTPHSTVLKVLICFKLSPSEKNLEHL